MNPISNASLSSMSVASSSSLAQNVSTSSSHSNIVASLSLEISNLSISTQTAPSLADKTIIPISSTTAIATSTVAQKEVGDTQFARELCRQFSQEEPQENSDNLFEQILALFIKESATQSTLYNGMKKILSKAMKEEIYFYNINCSKEVILLDVAIAEKEFEAAAAFIKLGVSANSFIWNDSLLSLACRRGDLRGAQFLLENKANPESSWTDDKTPMENAIHSGHLALVQLLHKYGVPLIVDGAEAPNPTPLSLAAGSKNSEILAYFLENGGKAKVNVPDIHGNPPLHLAVWRGNLANVKLLVAAGADPTFKYPSDAVNENYGTVLEFAKRYYYPEIAQYLESVVAQNAQAKPEEKKQ